RGDRHDPCRDLAVERMVAAQEDGLRPSPAPRRLREAPRAPDRHRRSDPVPPGRVAGGGDNSPASSSLRIGADHDGATTPVGVSPFLHRGVERVHVEMRDDPHRGDPPVARVSPALLRGEAREYEGNTSRDFGSRPWTLVIRSRLIGKASRALHERYRYE